MKLFTFRLPDIGEGIVDAEIVEWRVKPGDRLAEDQSMVDVMTDKATVDLSAPVAGRVVAIHGEVGGRIAVGAPLVELEIEGGGETEAVPAAAAAPEPKRGSPASNPAPAQAERPLASPAVRQRAHDHGIALDSVAGTGPEGRITAADLDAAIATRVGSALSSGAAEQKRTGVSEQKIFGLRRRIAEKMRESKQHIPHFGYVEEFDLTELEVTRRELNANRPANAPKLTLLPFIMRAVIRLVPSFPHINARYDDEAGVLTRYEGCHIGIATQTERGLLVPVVRHAEALTIWESAREMIRLVEATRAGSATREELTGSTITLTSLGALGGIAATPIINYPEVAIIGPNKLVERPVAINGQVVIRMMMNLSSSFDHRIVDGYDAARFVQGMKRLLEHPALLFADEA